MDHGGWFKATVRVDSTFLSSGASFHAKRMQYVLTAVLPWRLMLGVLCMYRAVPNGDFGLRFRPTMKQGLCRSCGCEMGVANACREDVRSQALKSIAVCS